MKKTVLTASGTLTRSDGTEAYMSGYVQFTFKGYFQTTPDVASVLDRDQAIKHMEELSLSHPRLTIVMHAL